MSAQQQMFPTKVGYKPQQYDLEPVRGAQLPDTSRKAAAPFLQQIEANRTQRELDNVTTKLNRDIQDERLAQKLTTPQDTSFIDKLAPFAPSLFDIVGKVAEEAKKQTQKNLFDRAVEELAANSDDVVARMQNQSDATSNLVDRAKGSGVGNSFINKLLQSDSVDDINKFTKIVEDLVPQHITGFETLLRTAEPGTPSDTASLQSRYMSQVTNDLGIGTQYFDPAKALVIRSKLQNGLTKKAQSYNDKLNTAAAEDMVVDVSNAIIGGGSWEKGVQDLTGLRKGDQILSRSDAVKLLRENLSHYFQHGGTDEQFLRLLRQPGVMDKNKPLYLDQPDKMGPIIEARKKYLENQQALNKDGWERRAQATIDEFELQTAGAPTEKDLKILQERLFDIDPSMLVKHASYVKYWEDGRTKDDIRDNMQESIIQGYIDRGVEMPEEVRLRMNPDVIKKYKPQLDEINLIYNSKEVKDIKKQGHAWIKNGTPDADGGLTAEGLTLQFTMDKGSTDAYQAATRVFDKMYNSNLKDLRSARGDNPENNSLALQMTKDEVLAATTDKTSVFYYDKRGTTHATKFPNINRQYYTNTGKLKYPTRTATQVAQDAIVASNRNKMRARDIAIDAQGDLTALFKNGYWQTFVTPSQYKRDEEQVTLSGRLPANSVFNQMGQGVNRPGLDLYDLFAEITGLVKPSSEIGPDLGATPGLQDALSLVDSIPQNLLTPTRVMRKFSEYTATGDPNQPLTDFMSDRTRQFEQNLGEVTNIDGEKRKRFLERGGILE